MPHRNRSATFSLALALASVLAVESFSPSPSATFSASPVTFERPTTRKFSNDALTEDPQHEAFEKNWEPQRRHPTLVRSSSDILSGESAASSSSAGLTKEEEVEFSFRLRTLRAALKLRKQNARKEGGVLIQPSHVEWAAACGTSVMDLRRILHDGQEAREALVAANIGLVTNLAKRHYYYLHINFIQLMVRQLPFIHCLYLYHKPTFALPNFSTDSRLFFALAPKTYFGLLFRFEFTFLKTKQHLLPSLPLPPCQ